VPKSNDLSSTFIYIKTTKIFVNSLLDDVNAILKLNQGNKIRLEHIKKTLESKKVLYISDSKYLRELTKEFLENFEGKRLTKFNSYDYPEYANRLDISKDTSESKFNHSVKKESNKNLFCGNCGNSIKDENFCPKCGHSLQSEKNDAIDEIKIKESKMDVANTPQKETTNDKKSSKKIIIGLGVLIVVIVVGVVAMNADTVNNINDDVKTSEKQKVVTNPTPSNTNTNSKCGEGTIFDEIVNSCVLIGTQNVGTVKQSTTNNSKCGAGTVFHSVTNLCVLEGTEKIIVNESQSNTNSKCGAGTVFDSVTNTCVIP
jgi:hypothetical protein